MPNFIDLTGKTFGRLKVLKRDETRKGVYWICECQCEDKTQVSVRGDLLKNENTVSCGCVNRENIKKKRRNSTDLTGKKFDLLTVIRYVGSDDLGTIWECLCRCGNKKNIHAYNLTGSRVKSCGCVEEETQKENVKNFREKNIVCHTNLKLIQKTEANANSTSGIRGVSWSKSKNRFIATITFQGKHYYLGSSKNVEECAEMRRVAEAHLFKDFLDWYEEHKENKNNTSIDND